MNKTIPKNATLYCPNCMIETQVVEGQVSKEHPHALPIFCSVCKQQVSEFIFVNNSWRLNPQFYAKVVTEKP